MKKPFSRYEVFAHLESLLDANRELRRKGFVAEPSLAAVKDVQEEMIHTLPIPRTIASLAAPFTNGMPAVGALTQWPELEARKQLSAIGLQYYDQGQFFAAIRRSDHLAVAQEVGKPEITQLLT